MPQRIFLPLSARLNRHLTGLRGGSGANVNFTAFIGAAYNGRLDMMDYLIKLAPEKTQDMLAEEGFAAFSMAADGGHLPVMKKLIELAPDKIKEMITANGYRSLEEAAYNGDLEMLKFLIENLRRISPDEVKQMATVLGDNWLRPAAEDNHVEIINYLFTIPRIFASAEMHEREVSSPYVISFIKATLAKLHTQYNALEAANPNAVFNLDDAETNALMFYIIRHLIRRNDPQYLDEIRFLLNIPSVKRLAHCAGTTGPPNELVRLALTIGNQGAADILLGIPAVRELAAQQNFYQNEIRGQFNLRDLAQDRESSMKALTTEEQRR